MPFDNLFYFINVKKYVLFLSVLVSVIAALFISPVAFAQSSNFKLKTQAEDTRVVLTIQNLQSPYTNALVSRDKSGFTPVKCSNGIAASGSESGGYVFDPNVEYCDSNVQSETVYKYRAVAKHLSNPDLVSEVSQPFKVKAMFKIDTRAEDKQIVLTVQNLSAPYKNVLITRNVGGFAPVKCTGGGLATGDEAAGFLIEPGIQYCDTNVTPETTYNYHAIATHPPDPDLTLDVSQPYKVTGNSNTSGYKPLFGTYDLDQFINALINWVAFRVGPILVGIMIIYAGFEYIASKGDEAKTKLAKSRIYGSIIGFILLMLIGTIMRGFFL